MIQHLREKLGCQDCDKISQSPAPFHVTAHGWVGPSLLAMILFEAFGQHQPLNRQAERYARKGVPVCLSTLADVLGRIAEHSNGRPDERLPWNWAALRNRPNLAA